jgi:isopentenyl-diphosphate Delta-isomerase
MKKNKMTEFDIHLRQSRKLEHIHHCLQLTDGPKGTGLDDISLIHNCIPDLNLAMIDLQTAVAGIKLSSPIILNAITGGAHDVLDVNRQLAIVARICNIPIAVGSQTAAIEDAAVRETFCVVRQENPQGVVIANLGASANCEAARHAVEMIDANILQIHLNVAQELAMHEGDRDFQGYAEHIKAITSFVSVPVIAKEVGFGIAQEQAKQLVGLGISGIDIGGQGGTNFAAIETARSPHMHASFLDTWGIPTACSLVEVVNAVGSKIDIIASGGIRTAADIVKALALGANAVGIAAPCLRILSMQGLDALITYIKRLQHEVRCIMLLTGAQSIPALRTKPVLIGGQTAHWLYSRGINIEQFARR